MNDMTPLQEALAPRSDQLNADDLIVGPRTLKITGARIVEGDRGGKKITINFEGDNGKPWKPCKTMGRAMVMVWAVTDEAQFVGKSVTVYRDPEVAFGDQGKIGGIRISHMSHIDSPKTVKLTVSQGKKSTFVFEPLTADVVAMPDKAAAWVADQIAATNAAADAGALDSLTSKGAKAMGKLQTERPELHAQVLSAYEAKRATFDDEEDPFGLPTPNRTTTDALLSGIAAAKNASYLDAMTEQYRDAMPTLTKEQCAEVEAALSAAREAVGEAK